VDSGTFLYLFLGGLIVVIISGVIIADIIRKKDFKDQISGKKPERKMNIKKKISYDSPIQENVQTTIDREVLRSRSAQNVLGPK
jgi:aspartokinase-like uncharacterized kinase